MGLISGRQKRAPRIDDSACSVLAYADGFGQRLEQGVGRRARLGPFAYRCRRWRERATANPRGLSERESDAARAAIGNEIGHASREAPLGSSANPPWIVAHANRVRQLQQGGSVADQWRWTRDGDGWTFESPVPGVDDGTPGRLDRERLLGNAVVWQQGGARARNPDSPQRHPYRRKKDQPWAAIGSSNFCASVTRRPRGAFLEEVRNQTGYRKGVIRTADALAMSLYPSRRTAPATASV